MTVRTYTSRPTAAGDRGYEFGLRFAEEIRANVDFYLRLFETSGQLGRGQVSQLGEAALEAIDRWAPALREEIEALAAGSDTPVPLLGALNARTEILGICRASARECTVAVALDEPVGAATAVQTWDWHDEVANGWLVWTVELPCGRVLHTLTEFGIVGKVGVNSSRLGLLLNILRHDTDGGPPAVPIHVLCRRVLEGAEDLNQALTIIASAPLSASSAITLVAAEGKEQSAVTVEMRPDALAYILPDSSGLLVHTNHFLDAAGAQGDEETTLGPDSFVRYELIRRRLSGGGRSARDVIAAMNSHLGGGGAICCHPQRHATLGERYATLATVSIDLAAGLLHTNRGGPCASLSPEPEGQSAPRRERTQPARERHG